MPDIILKEIGPNKISVIKVILELTDGLGLKGSKDLAESAPVTLLEGLSEADATTAMRQLEDSGAVVEIRHSKPSAATSGDDAIATRTFNVVLMDSGRNQTKTIKTVRKLTKLDLKDSRQLVRTAPVTILEGTGKDEAYRAKELLERHGATVVVS